LTLSHRDVQDLHAAYDLHIDKDGDQFDKLLHMSHMNNATVAEGCEAWCTRKVEDPKTNPDGSIQESEQCKNDENGQPWNKQCTWNIVCSYNSGKCKACPKCKSRCEPWCEGKVGRQECGKEVKRTCTLEEVCGFGNGVKCSDCGICQAPTTTKQLPGVEGCADWCAGKINKKECDQKNTLCTWNKICAWSSGKCSKCDQCPTADPTCSMGARSKLGGADAKKLCCKHTCGSSCGGPDCAQQGRNSADCCGQKIFSSKKSCNANLPPCILKSQSGEKNGSNRVKTLLGLGWAILMALAAAA